VLFDLTRDCQGYFDLIPTGNDITELDRLTEFEIMELFGAFFEFAVRKFWMRIDIETDYFKRESIGEVALPFGNTTLHCVRRGGDKARKVLFHLLTSGGLQMNFTKAMIVSNVAWANESAESSPEFFETLASGQNPRVLWIGCSDSRVPAETITRSMPGELFVHRNIANLFHPDDDNSVSVLEYAVRVLKVGHVIVCGHYGCGGVRASLLPPSPSLPHVNRRIAPICALAHSHRNDIAGLPVNEAADRLAEFNVLEQVRKLRETVIVREADPAPLVHGWIFSLADGRLKVLEPGTPYVNQLAAAAKPEFAPA
jgi:carbonic anhydrase